jgi:NADPH:quinone reductase-like Zn-dependent oxidoreductase
VLPSSRAKILKINHLEHQVSTRMKALVLDAEERTAIVKEIATPIASAGEILVEVKAIALNPIDPLYVRHPLANTGRTIGSDFAGYVTSMGSDVPLSSGLHIGARVAGFLQGACSINDRPGAFAEFARIDWDLVWKIPDDLSFEEASGVSLVSLTAAQGMWFRMGLPAPFDYNKEGAFEEHPNWTWLGAKQEELPDIIDFFVYGASTSVGLYAAQMIRISAEIAGKQVRLLGAASKARWEMLRTIPYGYAHLVDYRDTDWSQQIRKLTDDNGVHFAYDCISERNSVENVSFTLATKGRSAIVRSRAGGAWKAGELPFEPIYGAVWEGLGEEVQYQAMVVKRSPAARAFAVAFYKWLGQAMGSSLRPVPIRSMPGGLSKVVEDGFLLLGSGSMDDRKVERREERMRPLSAEKLVYSL